MLLVKLFSEFNGNTACPILPSDLHLALTEDFSNIGERSTKVIPYEKVDWPYMTHLPERIPLVGLILFDFPPLTHVQDAEPVPGNDNGQTSAKCHRIPILLMAIHLVSIIPQTMGP